MGSIILPIIVVAASKLGVINHTLLTVRHAQSLGIKEVLGVVINHTSNHQGVDDNTNPLVIKSFLKIPILGVAPYLSVFHCKHKE